MSLINTTHPKQTSAYLKRRAIRLRKKAQFMADPIVREDLLQRAARANGRANMLYNTCE